MPTSLDPVLIYAASFLLGAIFLAGAYDKLKDRDLFVGVVQAYGLLPVPLVVVFSFFIALAELAIGLALWVPSCWPAAQLAGCALLAVVTVAVVINLLRGHTELSCGCGGASADQELSWSLVARNVVLTALLFFATATPLTRALTGFDYGTIVLATGVGFGLYAALNQLLANTPRLASFGYSG
jgi:Methylamine utilisation protein MauE